jgi:hypothetical protein
VDIGVDPELVFRYWSSFYAHTPRGDFMAAVCLAIDKFFTIFVDCSAKNAHGASPSASSSSTYDFPAKQLIDGMRGVLTAVLIDRVCDMEEGWKTKLEADWFVEGVVATLTPCLADTMQQDGARAMGELVSDVASRGQKRSIAEASSSTLAAQPTGLAPAFAAAPMDVDQEMPPRPRVPDGAAGSKDQAEQAASKGVRHRLGRTSFMLYEQPVCRDGGSCETLDSLKQHWKVVDEDANLNREQLILFFASGCSSIGPEDCDDC